MPQRTATIQIGPFAALANTEIANQLVRAVEPEHLARVRADAERHSTRLFANAMVNVAWRNGPVENVHAGVGAEYPLDQRRVTLAAEPLISTGSLSRRRREKLCALRATFAASEPELECMQGIVLRLRDILRASAQRLQTDRVEHAAA
jgi:hypothetical protein